MEDESRKAARAILDLQDFALNYEVEKIEIVATSAVRDASIKTSSSRKLHMRQPHPCEFSRKKRRLLLLVEGLPAIHIFQTQSAFALWILVEVVLSVSNIKIEM